MNDNQSNQNCLSPLTSQRTINLINLVYDDEFVSLINSLSTMIKSFYKTTRSCLSELNISLTSLSNQTLYSKCLLNEISTSQSFQKTYLLLERIDNISDDKQVMDKSLNFMDRNLLQFFDEAKEVFKKMKMSRTKKIENITTGHHIVKGIKGSKQGNLMQMYKENSMTLNSSHSKTMIRNTSTRNNTINTSQQQSALSALGKSILMFLEEMNQLQKNIMNHSNDVNDRKKHFEGSKLQLTRMAENATRSILSLNMSNDDLLQNNFLKNQLQSLLVENKTIKADMSTVINQLHSTIQSQNNEIIHLKKGEEMTLLINSLKSTIDVMKTKEAFDNKSINDLSSQNGDLLREINNINIQHEKIINEMALQLKKMSIEKNEQINVKDKEMINLKEKLNLKVNQMNELEQSMIQVKHHNEKLITKGLNITTELEEKNKIIHELNTFKETYAKEIKDLNSELTQSLYDLSKAHKEIESLTQTITTQQSTIEKLKEEITKEHSLQKELNNRINSLMVFSSEKKTIEHDRLDLEKENQQLQMNHNSLLVSQSDLNTKLIQAKAEINTLSKEKNNLLVRLDESIVLMHQEQEKASHYHRELTKEKEKMKESHEALNEELKKLKEELANVCKENYSLRMMKQEANGQVAISSETHVIILQKTYQDMTWVLLHKQQPIKLDSTERNDTKETLPNHLSYDDYQWMPLNQLGDDIDSYVRCTTEGIDDDNEYKKVSIEKYNKILEELTLANQRIALMMKEDEERTQSQQCMTKSQPSERWTEETMSYRTHKNDTEIISQLETQLKFIKILYKELSSRNSALCGYVKEIINDIKVTMKNNETIDNIKKIIDDTDEEINSKEETNGNDNNNEKKKELGALIMKK